MTAAAAARRPPGPGRATAGAITAVATATGPSATVYGVHGAAGRTHWKAFAGRRQLGSATEAVEWASIPPGGISGEHRHTRTEELYLIVAGRGEVLLNGVPHPVAAGSVALTGVGNVHGLRNTGSDELNWWVIETLPPTTTALLSGARPPHGGAPLSNVVVTDLFAQGAVDTTGIFSGPLHRIDLVDVAAGCEQVIGRADAELAVYLHHGRGTGHSSVAGEPVRLAADTCLLIPAGAQLTLAAETDLRASVVSLRVPPAEAAR
ncbi:cupin domain-containing protein [Solwaraspora sp. WMMD791]|uniref:cupin domain-containing protein n=1 Tax=Solwaraspora sp. WMMD791 TaxID=3016086 RepID=UPI00249B0845|nr:cupin domain-containing protein [Solwaraspora sp. WMMD791]WFE28330.1 cupin domain-containing protein [Solwaraspora sp. WMMD791]